MGSMAAVSLSLKHSVLVSGYGCAEYTHLHL